LTAGSLYRLLGEQLGYATAKSQHVFRDFINAVAQVIFTEREIVIRFQKRAHNPLLMAAGFDKTDLPVSCKPPDLAKRGGCWFETDRVKIHLGIDRDFHPATKAHPGLLVSDLQAIIERCRERGFAIVDEAPLEGYQRIFINDPFGNRLELMQKV
jgi:hypothetical protein